MAISMICMLFAALGLGFLLVKAPKLLVCTLILAGACAVALPLVLRVNEEFSCFEEIMPEEFPEGWRKYSEDEENRSSWIQDFDEKYEDVWSYEDYEDPQIYYYSGNVVDGKTIIDFSITFYSDGSYMWYETPISSMIGYGTYEIEDSILIMTDDAEVTGTDRVNRFQVEEDSLVFIAEGSSNFPYVTLEDGDEFILGENPVEGWMDAWTD